MPKTDIDYSSTIIYKITCKDKTITDVYVGHTTNFVQRKHAHKQNCINNKSANHTCKLYEFIRANGGWINWKMEIINFYNCVDHYAARKKEQEHYILLNATLNTIEPLPLPKVALDNIILTIKPNVDCSTCDIKCSSLSAFNKHVKTNKHQKLFDSGLVTKKNHISSKKFICKPCDYKCSKKNDMTKHETSQKHKCNIAGINCSPIFVKNELKCNLCGKIYKSRVGLWRHKKTCMSLSPPESIKPAEPHNPMEQAFLTNLVLEVVKNNSEMQKQNQEFQKQMMDMYKNTNTVISNNSHNNSYNKTFNMQFFLNEQCKDAMNIMDFVDSMTLDFADLEDVGKLGYVEGISSIIIRKLNELDIYKRPIHCSDGKREIMFVKDNNVWEKENGNYDRLRKAIKHITKKNGDLMIPWSKENPNCMDIQHKMNDVYLQIMSQSMGGRESFVESENKIMKKIAKAVLIDK